MDCYTEDKKKQLAAKHRELSKAKKRIAEIDALIQKIYEDNASGKLSDERYATLSRSYEEEQKTLKAAVPELKVLTPELIHEFVDKIVVYAPRYLDGRRVQLLDIYYSGVGIHHELTRRRWKKPSGITSLSVTKRKRRNHRGYTVSKKQL